MPEIICYMADCNDEYYEEQAKLTEFDPRSVDHRSPSLFEANGYIWDDTKELLYEIHDHFMDEPKEATGLFDSEEMTCFGEGEDDKDAFVDILGADRSMAERCLQEDHIVIGCGSTLILAPRAIPENWLNTLNLPSLRTILALEWTMHSGCMLIRCPVSLPPCMPAFKECILRERSTWKKR